MNALDGRVVVRHFLCLLHVYSEAFIATDSEINFFIFKFESPRLFIRNIIQIDLKISSTLRHLKTFQYNKLLLTLMIQRKFQYFIISPR